MTLLEGIGNQYVTFGYNSVNHKVVRLGSFKSLNSAKGSVRLSNYHHKGIAKVQHPQKIWFHVGGEFVPVDESLNLEVITLLGV